MHIAFQLSFFYACLFFTLATQQISACKFCQVNASDVIILEGILVFHDARVRNLMSMKIFVDTGSTSLINSGPVCCSACASPFQLIICHPCCYCHHEYKLHLHASFRKDFKFYAFTYSAIQYDRLIFSFFNISITLLTPTEIFYLCLISRIQERRPD